jgi:hypothetical protein
MSHLRAKSNRVSRRTLLKGAGVAMSLPWMESIPVWGLQPSSTASPSPFPQRFAVLFMACGIHPDHWWAKGAGADMELSQSLTPLEPIKQKVNVIQGLFNKNATGVGIHPGQTGNILSGASLQKGAELRGGISVDQVLANHLGQETAQPSMVLGCEQPITGYHETNFSMAYSSHISWQNATSPVPMEVYPSLAFDSLFDNRGNRRNQSVLDRVKDHAASLSRQASASDRSKLDEYLTSVREVEKRIERARTDQAKADEKAKEKGQNLITMKRPDNGLPEDIRALPFGGRDAGQGRSQGRRTRAEHPPGLRGRIQTDRWRTPAQGRVHGRRPARRVAGYVDGHAGREEPLSVCRA